MKRKIILRLFCMIAFLTVFWSCHNEDFTNGKAELQRNNASFFLHAKKGNAAAKAGVDYAAILEAYNRENDFLATMPDQQGMPIWDKMKVVNTDNATGLLIPLSHDNETMSSVLFATLDAENTVTGVKDYDNKLLENIVYNENISHDLRERLFYTFMYMDNRTFGNEHFTGIPNDLFVGKRLNENPQWIRIGDFKNSGEAETQTDASGKILILETNCGMVHQCTHHGGGGTCDNCSSCYFYSCDYIMVYIPDEGFPGSSGFPGSGSGGGPVGCNTCPDNTPPKDPCTMSTVFYRIKPGCLGSGGDLGTDGLDDPCVKTKKMFQKPKVQQAIDAVTDQAKKAALDANEGEIGRIEKNGDFYPADVSEDHHVTFNNISGATGIYHNHTYNGAKMLSPPDIYSILSFAQEQPSSNYGDAYVGMIGAEKCYPAVAGCYRMFHYLIRFSATTADLSKSFTEDEMKELENKYRDREGELKEKIPYVDFLGDVTLNKKGYEKLFFETLAKMGLSGKVILQRIDDDGKIYNINLDANGIPEAIPCP